MVDACATYDLKASTVFGTSPIPRLRGHSQCFPARNAPGLDAAPEPDEIAQRVFSSRSQEVVFAKRIVEAMPDGTGAAMIDGKMQGRRTWKQAKVILDLAKLVAARSRLKAQYGL